MCETPFVSFKVKAGLSSIRDHGAELVQIEGLTVHSDAILPIDDRSPDRESDQDTSNDENRQSENEKSEADYPVENGLEQPRVDVGLRCHRESWSPARIQRLIDGL
jgi:hypothetical protein